MKKLLLISLAVLTLGSGMAFAQPESQKDEVLWLQTGTRWTRTDSYGKDLNHNGRIDDSEWVKRRSRGFGKQPPAWAQPPVKPGETHRWSVSTEEVWEERSAKANQNP